MTKRILSACALFLATAMVVAPVHATDNVDEMLSSLGLVANDVTPTAERTTSSSRTHFEADDIETIMGNDYRGMQIYGEGVVVAAGRGTEVNATTNLFKKNVEANSGGEAPLTTKTVGNSDLVRIERCEAFPQKPSAQDVLEMESRLRDTTLSLRNDPIALMVYATQYKDLLNVIETTHRCFPDVVAAASILRGSQSQEVGQVDPDEILRELESFNAPAS